MRASLLGVSLASETGYHSLGTHTHNHTLSFRCLIFLLLSTLAYTFFSLIHVFRWLLAHHWSQFFPRFIDRCYTPADSSLFVRAVCDQYHTTAATAQLSDEQQCSLQAVPLSSDDFAFTKRTADASAQLLLLMLQETSAAEPEMRRKALCILARLGMAQFGKSDGSGATAAEIAQLMKSLSPQLDSPCMPVWRAAARRVLNVVAGACSGLAAALFYETLARWRCVLPPPGTLCTNDCMQTHFVRSQRVAGRFAPPVCFGSAPLLTSQR